jgi:Mn-dependent DtxR family transcriptional regulator
MKSEIKSRYQQNSKGVLLPYRLVETCYEQGNDKSLTLFVKLKRVHRNGVFYNASARSIAKVTGISHATVNTHLKKLASLGLVRYIKGKNGVQQLQLVGYRQYTKAWGRELVFIEYGSKKEINARIKAQIAIRHIKTQEYNIGRKQGRNRKWGMIVESPINYASLSDRNLAEVMGVSNCTANRMKSEWSELGLITVRPMWSIIQTGVSESHYKKAKAFGAIPSHAVFERNRKRILIRMADAVSIGIDSSYKYVPNTWVPPMVIQGYNSTPK